MGPFKSSKFIQAWNYASQIYEQKSRENQLKWNIDREIYIAIIMYTEDDIYLYFNQKTRDYHENGIIGEEDCATLYDLLKRAFAETSLYQRFEVLYRCINKPHQMETGSTYWFPQYASTSLNKDIAHAFRDGNLTNGGTLYEIRNAKGIYVGDVSKYSREEEVLISPREDFNVIKSKKDHNKKYIENILLRIG